MRASNPYESAFSEQRVKVHNYFERAWWARKLNLRFHFSRVFQAMFDGWFLSTVPCSLSSNGTHVVMRETTQAVTFLVDAILGSNVEFHANPFKETVPTQAEIISQEIKMEDFKNLLSSARKLSNRRFEEAWRNRVKRYTYRFNCLVRALLIAWSDHIIRSNVLVDERDVKFDAYELMKIALESIPEECRPTFPRSLARDIELSEEDKEEEEEAEEEEAEEEEEEDKEEIVEEEEDEEEEDEEEEEEEEKVPIYAAQLMNRIMKPDYILKTIPSRKRRRINLNV